jgi:hypothetical protein
MNFWEKANTFRPPLVRMMARKGNRPMTAIEVADASIYLMPATVEAITQSLDWRGIDIHQMQSYLVACNMDFCDIGVGGDMRRAENYFKRTNGRPQFDHLRRSPEWKTYWKPLMTRWRRGYGVVTANSDIWPPLRDALMRLTILIK